MSLLLSLTSFYLSLMGPLGTRVYTGTIVQKLEPVGFPLRGPEISALNKELCVWLVWFTGNTFPDQCVWPGPATCWVSGRVRRMAGLWDAEWRETVPAPLLSKRWRCWRGFLIYFYHARAYPLYGRTDATYLVCINVMLDPTTSNKKNNIRCRLSDCFDSAWWKKSNNQHFIHIYFLLFVSESLF